MNMSGAKSARSRIARNGGWAGGLTQFRVGLYRYLLRCLRNADNAEELAQEVYLRLLRVENPERVQNPQAYMYRVAVNALQEFKAREEASVVAFDSELAARLGERLSDDTASAERLCNEPGEEQALEALIAQLPPMQRKVLLMATCQNLPHAQIAATLGLSINTVRNHLYRALFFCRRMAANKGRT
jgi:RNA polymerase sigma-70 factor (ECF subfamily)